MDQDSDLADNADQSSFQELSSILDDLDQSVRELDRLCRSVEQISLNSRAPDYLRNQCRNEARELRLEIRNRRLQALTWRLLVIGTEITNLCQERWPH